MSRYQGLALVAIVVGVLAGTSWYLFSQGAGTASGGLDRSPIVPLAAIIVLLGIGTFLLRTSTHLRKRRGAFLAAGRDVQVEGGSTDAILEHLRSVGASRNESIAVLHDLLGLSISDAAAAVRDSPIWADKLQ
jgi:hypothetical protein